MKRFLMILVVLCAGIAILTSTVTAMDETDLTAIQEAIEEKGAGWTAADNPIFRLSPEEQRRLCGLDLDRMSTADGIDWIPTGPKPELPERWDWRDVDGVDWTTPVRNQGPCGSCVAFGVMGAFEARVNIFAGSPGTELDLSEQHIFSCGGGSCNNGWWYNDAAQYLQDHGAPLESCSPYKAVDDNCYESCSHWSEQARKVEQWSRIRYSNEVVEQMKMAIMEGPLVGGFSVMDDFFSYSGGVYEYTWGYVAGGHATCFIGWDDAENCWICKNSWGPSWGDNGYFRIRMGRDEVGIEEYSLILIPQPPASAHLELEATQIDDHLSNADGLIDPEETLDFFVTLSNKRTYSDLTDLSGWLIPMDSRLEIVDVEGHFPDVPNGESTSNQEDPFTITMDHKIGIKPIQFNMYLTGTCQDAFPYSTDIGFELPVVVNLTGWPVATTSGVSSSPLMVWNGGGPRRLVGTEDRGRLHLWEWDGREVEGFPFLAPGGNILGSVAMGDLDGDGREEFVFGSKNDTLYAVCQDGSLLFKRDMGADVLVTPTLADLNADGSPEIVFGTAGSELHVLTAQGQKLYPFPVVLSGPIMADAAVADIDDDGVLDVVVGASDGQVSVISVQTGEMLPGFPFDVGGAIWSSPVVADLDGDGSDEVIVGCDAKKMFAIHSNGQVLFSYRAVHSIKSSPAIADLNQDGSLDVLFTSQDGRVYAVNQWGYSVYGWPHITDGVLLSSPVVADIDWDDELEVLLVADGPELLHLDTDGSRIMSLPLDGNGLALSTPAVGDLDNDGDLEIAVGGPRGIHVWNYPAASTVAQPWPMHRGNARRTGYVGDVTTAAPQRDDLPLVVPECYALSQNYPNPFNPETAIRYSLTQAGTVRLAVYNVLGQEVITLVSRQQPAGEHEVIWNGTDLNGRPVSSGLYFYRLEIGDFAQTKKMVLLR
jgi:C1A family cysteine protease